MELIDKDIRTYDNSYMANLLGSEIRNSAIKLRSKGYSLFEIATHLKISKSTSSLWLRNIKLNKQAKLRIEQIQFKARSKANNTIKKIIQDRRDEFHKNAGNTITKLKVLENPSLCKLLCSILYWGEGNKTGYRVAFTNSDPVMIGTFLKLLRYSFPLHESKFRALVHIHEYHDETEIKNYWSKITNIPISQFTKSYLKPHTAKIIRDGYMGTIRIAYADTRIVDELKAVYNELAKSLGL